MIDTDSMACWNHALCPAPTEMLNKFNHDRRHFSLWLWGLIAASLLAWCAAPYLTDTILVRVAARELNDVVWGSGQTIRWRSEGWGTTQIGPYGLPGWKPIDGATRIALWGDSQLEGFCVDDAWKIHAQCQTIARQETGRTIDFVPCARSGTDARDWLQWMPVFEGRLQPSLHVLVVTDLDDLICLNQSTAPKKLTESNDALRRLADIHGELLFHAAKNVLWDKDAAALRRLDWRLIPRSSPNGTKASQSETPAQVKSSEAPDIQRVIDTLLATQSRPLAIVYAPEVPQVHALDHPKDRHRESFNVLRKGLEGSSISLVNLETPFLEHYEQTGNLPRGFHNGYPGLGHLNVQGNRIVAQAIVELALSLPGSELIQPESAEQESKDRATFPP